LRYLLPLCLGLLLVTAAQAAPPEKPVPPALHQEVDFSVSPLRVYQYLLDEKQFSAATGAPAKIAAGDGGSFTAFGGVISGRNIELVPGRRVVQAWRVSNWEPGVYSLAKFELIARGSGTHLVLDQTGYPASDYNSLVPGWPDHYWNPMRKYFH
jgi:activator of HSP90 ATPase